MECISSCCLVCRLYLRLFDSSVFMCVCVVVLYVFWKFVYDELYCVSAGWWRTTRPTWQRWPYCKNSQIHILYTHKCTHIHKPSCFAGGLSETIRWDVLSGSSWDEMRWKHRERWFLLINTCVSVFVGETWKERLHRRTWPWGFRGESYFMM